MASDEMRAQDLLLDEIRAEAWATRQYTGRSAFDERVPGKDPQSRVHERSVLPVAFVPLTGTEDS